jgi:uncharacterized sodium:solute symporter family permease YidK
MSSTVEHIPVAHPETNPRPAIPLVRLGLSLSIFLAISFLLCTVADVIPWLQDFHFLKALYPDVDWTNPAMIGAGVVWAFLSGWYVALGFGSLYNFFAARPR